jgi:peptidoglycan/LPS O-acetylase OafA/YrhL
MQNPVVSQKPEYTQGARLHYLDWLRVIAILGVFLYHAFHPFDLTDWHIKNAEQSEPLTAVMLSFAPWGMPFFFLIAGTGTWFALRHRTVRQYAVERFRRLFVPFIFGCILLTPLMLYLEWTHKTQTGTMSGTFWDFINSRQLPIGPEIFGWAGYHLWFLGFLFSFSLLALPFFLWLRQETGQQLVARLAGWCEHRGGILLAIIPLLLVQVLLRVRFLEGEHNWTDFFYMLTFFVLGYLLYTDERFIAAVRRDWRLIFAAAVMTLAVGMALIGFSDGWEWLSQPALPEFYLMWTLFVVAGWTWTLLMLFVGIRFLDFSNHWLQYGQEAILPFFLFHQPVIMGIAFFVVQWDAGIPLKLPLVVITSYVMTVGLYELLIRRNNWLRAIFGMKATRLDALRPVVQRRT